MESELPVFDDLNIPIEQDAPLGERTWYRTGGRAQYLARPASTAQLASLVHRCFEKHMPIRVLGSGANLLVRECGVPGMVISLDDPAFAQVQYDGTTVTAGPGADLMELVIETARRGLAGLDVLAGIPATVGGAVRMNAGGAMGDIGSSVASVTIMTENGQTYQRDRDDLVFGYRTTNIDGPIILDTVFELTEDDPAEVRQRVKQAFFYKKASQPMGARSAGCAFKNPPKDQAPPAGKLIDDAGLKGFALGSAQVSPVHGNFITISDTPGKADDVADLVEHVRQIVKDKFGVQLQREVVIWP